MITITSSIPNEMNNDLTFLAERLDRSKSYIVKQALKEYILEQLEDIEDCKTAMEVLNSGEATISLEDIEKKYALED